VNNICMVKPTRLLHTKDIEMNKQNITNI